MPPKALSIVYPLASTATTATLFLEATDKSAMTTTYNVYSGQTSAGVTLNQGDTENVFYGGVASDTTGSDAAEYVYAGALNEGGVMQGYEGAVYVDSGGVDEGGTVEFGATETAVSGAIVQGLTIGADADVVLSSGATLERPIFMGGEEDLLVGASVSGVTLVSAGLENLSIEGGSATALHIGSGAGVLLYEGGVSGVIVGSSGLLLAISGTAGSVTISSGGLEILAADVSQTSGTVLSGGSLTLADFEINSGTTFIEGVFASGAVEFGQTISSGGRISGSDLVITTGGRVLVGSLGSDSESVVSSGGLVEVLSGGTVQSLTVSGGASLKIYGGADVSDTDFTGGAETVASGYFESGLTVAPGGLASLTVSAGGDAESCIVSSGGTFIISSGGYDFGDVVSRGGVEQIASGGLANLDDVLAGGFLMDNGVLDFAGKATGLFQIAGQLAGSGVIEEDGPSTLLIAGTTSAFTGEVVISGGAAGLEVATGIGTGSVGFEATSGNATLQIHTADMPPQGATFLSPLVDFNSSTKRVDLLSQAYVSGATATVSGTTLTLIDGAYTAKFKLSASEATRYVVASDGKGGTLIHAAVGAPTRLLIEAAAGFASRSVAGALPAPDLLSDRMEISFAEGRGHHLVE